MIHKRFFMSRDLFSIAGCYPCLHDKVIENCSVLVKSKSYRIHFAKVYRNGRFFI